MLLGGDGGTWWEIVMITKLFKRWTVGVFTEEGKGQTTTIWEEGQPDRKAPSLTLRIYPRNVNTTTPVQASWHMGKYTLAQNTGHV